jgi:hypothetical protein
MDVLPLLHVVRNGPVNFSIGALVDILEDVCGGVGISMKFKKGKLEM